MKHLIVHKASDYYATIDGKELYPKQSLKVENHSPDGFSHGYLGSGPSQLALAILLEFVPMRLAIKHYHSFKELFIATTDIDRDLILDIDVAAWVYQQENGVTVAEHSIFITLDGGLVQAIEGMPEGYRAVIMDFDIQDSDPEELTEFLMPFDVDPKQTPVRAFVHTEKNQDTENVAHKYEGLMQVLEKESRL